MLIQRRRPSATHEQVEESGYMASASDLMIGLLFIFIVMVMVLLSRKPELPQEPPPDPLAAVVQAIGSRLQSAGVPVTINQASGVITLPTDTLFALGRPDLEPDGVRTLRQSAQQLQDILPCYIYSQRRQLPADCPPNPQQVEIETILIEGHTDASPLHRGDYTNWHLGSTAHVRFTKCSTPAACKTFATSVSNRCLASAHMPMNARATKRKRPKTDGLNCVLSWPSSPTTTAPKAHRARSRKCKKACADPSP